LTLQHQRTTSQKNKAMQYRLDITTGHTETVLCDETMKERIITRKAQDKMLKNIKITEITPDMAHMVILENCYFKIFADGRVALKNQQILGKDVEMLIKGVNHIAINDLPGKWQRIYIQINGKYLHYRREDGVEFLKWE
jgi:hypothetical protein